MSSGLDRVLRLQGTRNLRDLGGYATADGRQTRWRVLYRSDCLDKIDADAQLWLVQVGLRTIIDLRDDQEAAERPNVFASSQVVNYRRVPVWDEPLPAGANEPDLDNGYVRELDLRGTRLAEIVAEVARPGATPALIHCAAGKDRTGVVIGLLLAAVGVPHTTIAEDYALSAECLGPEYLALSQRWVEQRGQVWEQVAHLFYSPPERMLKTLAYVDEAFGGVERYLIQNGLPAERLTQLRELLTEPLNERHWRPHTLARTASVDHATVFGERVRHDRRRPWRDGQLRAVSAQPPRATRARPGGVRARPHVWLVAR